MIVIAAKYPAPEKQKDGMFQRILHIDSLMESLPRIYLELYFVRYLRKEISCEKLVTIYRLNVFTHFFIIYTLLKKAKLLYIHSAFNALRLWFFSTDAHVVFDAHGVVPEELAEEGRSIASVIYAFIERKILHRCHTLICVTNTMLNHFQSKYGTYSHRKNIILPILPRLGRSDENISHIQKNRNSNSVIYAGGIQVWQNIGKMLTAAQSQPDLIYTFLTADAENFKNNLSEIGLKQASCYSVAPDDVKDYYITHEYGFILRDEILVNLVACPTKLVEYLYWGVLPIVITPRIGDFSSTTLKHLSVEQFCAGDFPDPIVRASMREENRRTVSAMLSSAKDSQICLQNILSKFA
jgi:hypothetical protein